MKPRPQADRSCGRAAAKAATVRRSRTPIARSRRILNCPPGLRILRCGLRLAFGLKLLSGRWTGVRDRACGVTGRVTWRAHSRSQGFQNGFIPTIPAPRDRACPHRVTHPVTTHAVSRTRSHAGSRRIPEPARSAQFRPVGARCAPDLPSSCPIAPQTGQIGPLAAQTGQIIPSGGRKPVAEDRICPVCESSVPICPVCGWVTAGGTSAVNLSEAKDP